MGTDGCEVYAKGKGRHHSKFFEAKMHTSSCAHNSPLEGSTKLTHAPFIQGPAHRAADAGDC